MQLNTRRTRVRAAQAAIPCLLLLGFAAPVPAQVTRMEITSRELAGNGQAYGGAGQVELLRGRVHGEVDPNDRRNRIIQDIALAPRNARGRVEYVATFALARPVDASRVSGSLIYSVVNRGNGMVEPSAEGHVWVVSGWQGDVVPTPNNQSITVPIATNPDGSTITGPVLQRFANMPAGTTTLPLRAGTGYPHAAADQSAAVLTVSSLESSAGVKSGTLVVPRADWTLADCRTVPFPGTPDPTRLCVRNGFDPGRLYELVYTARDPLVLGIGLAATRDLMSFLKHEVQDVSGTPNPVAGLIRHAVAIGNSQSGNFIRTFIHLGFNEDLAGRIVWDGAFPRIAARQTPMNFRFALPGGAVDLYEPGSEGVLWWSRYEDSVRGRGPAASLLDRCSSTSTCPKIVEAFGSAEFWGLRMSPNLIGTDAKADIPLPANVRRYYMPGTTHGGGRGGFQVTVTGGAGGCTLPGNPNPMNEQFRALNAALVDWVVDGTTPPDSRYPTLAQAELVAATTAAVGFPAIPGLRPLDGLVKVVLDYDYGPGYIGNDVSGVITRMPPRIVQAIPTYVPSVDADGNETSGVASVLHQAPLGTYLGWNITGAGFFAGHGCGFQGGYVPFALTAAERQKTGDPRLSVEERYGTLEGYVCTVRQAADAAVRDRFLLRDDADRMIREAEQSGVLPAAVTAGIENRARGAARCGGQ
jgi:methyl coenzyme M reductase subunit C